jgi:hypothetical protein
MVALELGDEIRGAVTAPKTRYIVTSFMPSSTFRAGFGMGCERRQVRIGREVLRGEANQLSLMRDSQVAAARTELQASKAQAAKAREEAAKVEAADRANLEASEGEGGDKRSAEYRAKRAAKIEAIDLTTVHATEKDVNSGRPWGNSAAAAHRKLRRDRPDLHARVLSGEITANAAMVQAGFRKKRAQGCWRGSASCLFK